MILTLKKTIPSHSHNAPFSVELGSHWPAGQRFRRLSEKQQLSIRRWHRISGDPQILEQVGGEEVLLVVKTEQMEELFGVTA